MKIYAEAGIGNDTFFSTEFEEGEKEYRVAAFAKPKNIEGYYLRLWVCKMVYIFSTNEGFKITKKTKSRCKLIFGISGSD